VARSLKIERLPGQIIGNTSAGRPCSTVTFQTQANGSKRLHALAASIEKADVKLVIVGSARLVCVNLVKRYLVSSSPPSAPSQSDSKYSGGGSDSDEKMNAKRKKPGKSTGESPFVFRCLWCIHAVQSSVWVL